MYQHHRQCDWRSIREDEILRQWLGSGDDGRAGQQFWHLYRKLLKEQIELVQRGGQPMSVFRDPARNQHLTPPVHSAEDAMDLAGLYYRENYHKTSWGGWRYIDDDADRYCPDRDVLIRLFRDAETVRMRELERRKHTVQERH